MMGRYTNLRTLTFTYYSVRSETKPFASSNHWGLVTWPVTATIDYGPQ